MKTAPRILIVEGRFYNHIADLLVEGAKDALENANAAYEIIQVPGAFEIPTAIAMAESSGRYDGYVALGCVIRGQTTHYDYVCTESARGLNDLAINRLLAIGYGILTTENEAQAVTRADKNQKNKGGFAADTCLSMIELKQRFILPYQGVQKLGK